MWNLINGQGARSSAESRAMLVPLSGKSGTGSLRLCRREPVKPSESQHTSIRFPAHSTWALYIESITSACQIMRTWRSSRQVAHHKADESLDSRWKARGKLRAKTSRHASGARCVVIGRVEKERTKSLNCGRLESKSLKMRSAPCDPRSLTIDYSISKTARTSKSSES